MSPEQEAHELELGSWWWDRVAEDIAMEKGMYHPDVLDIIMDKLMCGEPVALFDNDMWFYDRVSLDVQHIAKNRRYYNFCSFVVKEMEKRMANEKYWLDIVYRTHPILPPDSFIHAIIYDKKRNINLYAYVIQKFSFYKTVASPWRKKEVQTLDVTTAKEVPIHSILQISKESRGRQMICCPLHTESTPSFCIYNNQNTWYCYGCGEGGDAIDLVQKMQHIEFKEALSYLQNYYGENKNI